MDLYPRIDTGVIRELVDRYCEFLRDLPAIEVNQRNEVIDGVLRLLAHKQAKQTTIRARITEVTNDLEHFSLACLRNSTHGLQLPIEVERRRRDEQRAKEIFEAQIQGEWTP